MPDLILFVGIQASGKSTFYREHFAHEYQYINLDTLRTRGREGRRLQEFISERANIVVDNTNPLKEDRRRYIVPAKEAGYRIEGYYFSSSIADCLERNEKRVGDAKVPRCAICSTHKKLELPELSEGFDALHYVVIQNGKFTVKEWEDQ